jgi:hypothetical protein
VDNLLVTTGFMAAFSVVMMLLNIAARKCGRKEKSKREREIIAGKDSNH